MIKNFLIRKIPVFYFLFLTGIAVLSTFLITYSYYHLKNLSQPDVVYNRNLSTAPSCDYNIRRLEGYNYIKPLLYVDKSCESGAFTPVKQIVVDIIDKEQQKGRISSASVYVRDFNQGDFMSINEDEMYKSSSLLDVPLLITYLHLDEDNSGYLNKEVVLNHSYFSTKNKVNTNLNTVIGQKYSLKKLLEYMIVNGDDNAAGLLYENVDKKAFCKTFTDIGLTAPKNISQDCPISATDISLFLRTLYNATYLTINNSEYATRLLSNGEYKNEGKVMGLPTTVRMAREYGVSNDSKDKELHESAIIYVNNCPYIITIMTKGNDLRQLSQVINQISVAVYKQIVGKSIT